MNNKVKIKQKVVNSGVIVNGEGLTKWGNIKGDLQNQSDLVDALGKKADSDSVYSRWELDEFISYLARKEELSDYITLEELDSRNYLTEHQDLSHLAEKSELSQYQEKGDYVTGEELEGKGYLTEHQDLSHLAEKSELSQYQPKGNYLTEIPENYVTNSELSQYQLKGDYITGDKLEEKGYLTEIPESYITESELETELGLLKGSMISTKIIDVKQLYKELYDE